MPFLASNSSLSLLMLMYSLPLMGASWGGAGWVSSMVGILPSCWFSSLRMLAIFFSASAVAMMAALVWSRSLMMRAVDGCAS